MSEQVNATSLHGFLLVLAAAALASIIVLPLVDTVLRQLGIVK